MHRRKLFLIFLLLVLRLTAFSASPVQERADRFLKLTNAGYQALFRVNSEAQWLAVTDVTPEHDAAVEATGKAYAAFNGNPAIITEARDLLTHEKELTPLSVRQLKQLLLILKKHRCRNLRPGHSANRPAAPCRGWFTNW